MSGLLAPMRHTTELRQRRFDMTIKPIKTERDYQNTLKEIQKVTPELNRASPPSLRKSAKVKSKRPTLIIRRSLIRLRANLGSERCIAKSHFYRSADCGFNQESKTCPELSRRIKYPRLFGIRSRQATGAGRNEYATGTEWS